MPLPSATRCLLLSAAYRHFELFAEDAAISSASHLHVQSARIMNSDAERLFWPSMACSGCSGCACWRDAAQHNAADEAGVEADPCRRRQCVRWASQVMAVASAEARADEAARRAADLEQQLAASSAAQATPDSAATTLAPTPDSEAAASKEAFLQSRVAELTAQLEEFRELAAAMTPRRAAGRDAAVEKLGSPDQGFAG